MPRNMSFALTTEQFKNQTKDVTRRFGWSFLKAGDVVCGVEKAMGLKKGEKIKRLDLIEVVSNTPEPLKIITQDEVIREGFPNWTPDDFINLLVKQYKCNPDKIINRIEYRYLNATCGECSKVLRLGYGEIETGICSECSFENHLFN